MTQCTSGKNMSQKEFQQSTSTSFTLLSQMMGASLLSLPSLVQKIGLVYVLILYISSVIIQALFYNILVKASCLTNSRTYKDLVTNVLGKKNGILLDVFIIINYYGVTTAYIIIAASTYCSFFEQVAGIKLNTYLVKFVVALIIFCLTLLKNLKQLGKIASIASLTIFVFAFTIVGYFFKGLPDKQLCSGTNPYKLVIMPDRSWIANFAMFLAYVPSTGGSFTAHTMIAPLLYEMEGPAVIRQKVLNVALIISMMLALVLYLFSGIMGADMFGLGQNDNVLTSFEPCKFVWIDIMQFMYGLVVIIVYPLVIYPIKVSFCEYLPQFKERNVHIAVSIIIVVMTLLLALFLEQILSIFGFFSSVSGFFMFYYYPLLIYIKMDTIEQKVEDKDVPADSVPIVIGSMLLPGNTEKNLPRLRALSDKNLPPVEAQANEIPFGRRKSFGSMISLSSHSDDSETLEPKQQAQNPQENKLKHEEAVNDQSVLIEEDNEKEETVKIPLARKITCYSLIVLFGLICIDGAVINLKDIIKEFS